MSEQHADQGYRSFWKTMKGMTWKERIQHFCYHYGTLAIVVVILVAVLADLAYEFFKPKPEVILSGTAVNVKMWEETRVTLVEDAFDFMGGEDPEKQEVKLVANEVSRNTIGAAQTWNTWLISGDYDYLLMDTEALQVLMPMALFTDISLLLTPEQMDPWKNGQTDRFCYAREEGKEQYPVAINIGGTPLAEGCQYEGDIYLAFAVQEERAAVASRFFEYLTQEFFADVH